MTHDPTTAAENRERGRRIALPARRELQVRILRHLTAAGPADDREIAAALSLKLDTVRRRRLELQKAGVVRSDAAGRWMAVPPLSATCPPASGQPGAPAQ